MFKEALNGSIVSSLRKQRVNSSPLKVSIRKFFNFGTPPFPSLSLNEFNFNETVNL